jgi:gluconate:H+ symporter, GntP family
MSVMATGLVGALQLTHAMVPPTPGPLAAVALVGADLGTVVYYGGLVTVIASFAGLAFAHVVGPHVESPPSREFVGQSLVPAGAAQPGRGAPMRRSSSRLDSSPDKAPPPRCCPPITR